MRAVGRHFGRFSTVRSTTGLLYFQSDRVPSSLKSTGRVGTNRDLLGSDGEFFGTDPIACRTEIADGRASNKTLDNNGFCMVEHAYDHIEYYDNKQVVDKYYRECEALITRETGASRVIAFDHNVRSRQQKDAGAHLRGGSAVQEPLITYGVHNDYTLASAPRRMAQLTQPLGANDTLKTRQDGTSPPISEAEREALLRGRWAIYNVWRNIAVAPVESFPLAMCDAATVSTDDLVVFEIRYSDRVGENYFARASTHHQARCLS